MNERIKQLAVQAGVSILLGDLTDEDTGKVERSRLEIFAEMIVKECADICFTEWRNNGDSYGILIKEHFGVEE